MRRRFFVRSTLPRVRDYPRRYFGIVELAIWSPKKRFSGGAMLAGISLPQALPSILAPVARAAVSTAKNAGIAG
jgi:hypothetical protein